MTDKPHPTSTKITEGLLAMLEAEGIKPRPGIAPVIYERIYEIVHGEILEGAMRGAAKLLAEPDDPVEAALSRAEGVLLAMDGDVMRLLAQHAETWRDRDDAYWFQRLVQEIGELGSSLAGDHEDPPEHELRQIASIALNWLRHRAALAGGGERVSEPPDLDTGGFA